MVINRNAKAKNETGINAKRKESWMKIYTARPGLLVSLCLCGWWETAEGLFWCQIPRIALALAHSFWRITGGLVNQCLGAWGVIIYLRYHIVDLRYYLGAWNYYIVEWGTITSQQVKSHMSYSPIMALLTRTSSCYLSHRYLTDWPPFLPPSPLPYLTHLTSRNGRSIDLAALSPQATITSGDRTLKTLEIEVILTIQNVW